MASIQHMSCDTWQAVVWRKVYRPPFHTFDSRHDAKQRARSAESNIDRAVFVDLGPSERDMLGELIGRHIAQILPVKVGSAVTAKDYTANAARADSSARKYQNDRIAANDGSSEGRFGRFIHRMFLQDDPVQPDTRVNNAADVVEHPVVALTPNAVIKRPSLD